MQRLGRGAATWLHEIRTAPFESRPCVVLCFTALCLVVLDSLCSLCSLWFRVGTAAQQSSEAFPCDDAKCEIVMIRDRIPHSAHSLTAPTPTRSTFLPTRPVPGAMHTHPLYLSRCTLLGSVRWVLG